jgi:Na+-driven multidrug efflux pump
MIALPVGITGLLPALMNSVANHLLSQTGAEAVAAFGAATRLEALLMVMLMALSIGMGPIIGQNWGAGKIDRVRETVKYAISFSVIWSLVTALILGTLAQIIAKLFSDDYQVQHYFILYLWIVPASYFLGHLVHGWGSALNAIGKPQISAMMIFIKIILLCIPAMIIGHYIAGVTGIFGAVAIVNCVTGLTYHLWSWKNLGSKWGPKTTSDV